MRVRGKQAQRILDTLQGGGRFTVADLSRITGNSDPRGHIRALRKKGIEVLSEWRPNVGAGRHKVYYML